MEGPPYSCACVSRRRWTSTSPPRAPRTKETSWPVLEVAGTGIIVHTYACMCRRKCYLAFCIHTSCHRVQMSESVSRECCAPLDTLRSRKYSNQSRIPILYATLESACPPRPARPHRAQRSDDVRLEVLGSSTAGSLNNRTKRSIVDNATSGIAPPPRAWSIQTGQCSAARTPPRAVRPSRWRDHEAARSNRRESPSSVPVTSQWCAQDGGGQPARTAWPPRRHPSRGSS